MVDHDKDPISVAITGLSCRFPGDGADVQSFWTSITEGKSAWSEIPADRFNIDAFYSAKKKRNTTTVRGAHFLRQNIAEFDSNFFGISQLEASSMDPQHRMMLEVAYEALESGGHSLSSIAGTRTGVFMGHFTSDYKELVFRDADAAPPYAGSGLQKTSLANRISWLWDLRGPSFGMDTACSSSLVALHLACQSLRTGESDMAIVGGTNLFINPDMFMLFSGQNFLSPDGKCKSFDASGDGYGRGEGFAAVILKRVDDAISAGDPLRAIIRGTGSNQDGHTRGFTLPSADAQADLINDVYTLAGLDFSQTGYVEAHGTGTQAGDTEEVSALATTISAGRSSDNKLIVGSVKANIGHLEAVAGLAGVIKSIMMLENGLVPPNIHFKTPNPKINFDKWNIKIPVQLMSWPNKGLRRISINSFGYGGTNAHAILDDTLSYVHNRMISALHCTKTLGQPSTSDEYIAVPEQRRRVFALSAQDREGLVRVRQTLGQFLVKKCEELDGKTVGEKEDLIADLAFTLGEKRSRLQWKSFSAASSLEELRDLLGPDNEEVSPQQMSSRAPRLGFVFTGQGAQWATMGMDLLKSHKTFRSSVEAADVFLKGLGCKWSAVEELCRGKSTSKLGIAEYSQTLCTVLQVGLVDLLREWDVAPVSVTGHSSGEIAAAYCIGALAREDAWKVAYFRGVLSSSLQSIALDTCGAMMAVGSSPEAATQIIERTCPDGEVSIACVNSPSSVTLSGDATGIDKLLDEFTASGTFARRLQVDTAYHSAHMQLIADDYLEAIADVEPRTYPRLGIMHSSVTKSVVRPGDLGPSHWVRNLISPVQFAAAVQDLVRPMRGGKRAEENAVDVLVEIGPHSALQGPATQSLKAIGIANIPYLSALVRNKSATTTALDLAGTLFTHGFLPDFVKINGLDDHGHQPRTLTDLPLYPWNHSQRLWTESRLSHAYRFREAPASSLLGAPAAPSSADEKLWRGFIRISEEPWVADHKIQGSILYPAAGFLAFAIEAALQSSDKARLAIGFRLRDIQLTAAMVLNEDTDTECTVSLRPHLFGTRDHSSTWMEFNIASSPDGRTLTRNAQGLIIVEYEDSNQASMGKEKKLEERAARDSYMKAKSECRIPRRADDFYQELKDIGFGYGPAFANVSEMRVRSGQACGVIEIPDIDQSGVHETRPHVIHPGTMDAVFHLAFAAANAGDDKLLLPMVPKSIDEVHISRDIDFAAHCRLKGFSNAARHGFKELNSDIIVLNDEEASPVLTISGFRCAEIAATTGPAAKPFSNGICSKLVWRPAINLLSEEEIQCVVQGVSERVTGETVTGNALYHLREYIEILHHSNPKLSILEITQSNTLLFDLNLASEVRDTANYTLAFPNDKAKAEFGGDILQHFAAVNIESLHAIQHRSQEKAGEFDLILVRDVTDMLVHDLQDISHLLKPSGRLCTIDDVGKVSDIASLFKNAKFSNVSFFDSGIGQSTGLTVASVETHNKTNGTSEAEHQVVVIRQPNCGERTRYLEHALVRNFKSRGYDVSTVSWGDIGSSSLGGKRCIAIIETETSLLQEISEKDFSDLQQVITEAGSLLWINCLEGPSSGLMNGMARVIRNERPGIDLATLNASQDDLAQPERLSELCCRVFCSRIDDNEFSVRKGVIYSSRVIEDETLNAELGDLQPQAAKTIENMALKDARGPLKLAIESVGILDSLYFDEDNIPRTELGADEIEIQVKATGLNFREVMTAMGQMPDKLLGFDAAGIVLHLGSAVDEFKIGDKVVMFGHGAHRTVHRSKAKYCALIPGQLSFEHAATIPVAHGTAWYGLVKLARAEKGQSILIHAAAGGVGQATIQLAQYYEMEIFATVGSERKRALLRDTYNIPDDHIFNSRDLSFVKGVKRMTGGRGVDIVLNSLSGEALRQTWYCIAPFGHFIEIGIKDILGNTRLDMQPFQQDASFSFFNLNHIAHERPELMAEIIRSIFDLLGAGVIRPIEPLVTYPLSQVESAFRLMQTGRHVGKIALKFDDSDTIPVARSGAQSIPLKLDSQASYVLVGGLGGLGRSLATMLADNGARKLCFLSRSGAASAEAKKLVADLEARNVQVKALCCDVSDSGSLKTALQKCTKELGTVRGVIQGAMVLRDVLFANMTHRQWVESTRPKVQGTWNLHLALPDVDFFVILSSFAGIFGNRGQANYAAGCAFQDAICHLRRAIGQKGMSLNVGLMRDIGVLAETGITEALREWEVPYGIRGGDFLDLVRLVAAKDAAGALADPQVLTGLATGGSALAAGITKPFYLDDAKFAIMANTGVRAQEEAAMLGSRAGHSLQVLLSASKSMAEAVDHVTTALVNRAAKMLQTPPSEIDVGRALHSYGIDSLVAIEIVTWALRELEAKITVFDVMAAVPITATATKISAASGLLRFE